MAKIIHANEARRITVESQMGKQKLLEQVNNDIYKAAKRGLYTMDLPSGLNTDELEWLGDQLLLAGYTVGKDGRTIYWRPPGE